MDKIDNYLEHLYVQEELMTLFEVDMNQIIAKFTPDKLKSITKKVQGSINKKDPFKSMKLIKTVTKIIPTVNVATVDKYMASKVKEYNSMKKMAEVVIKNSFSGASKQAVAIASSAITVLSLVGKKNEKITLKENLKKNVKEFVVRARKFGEDYNEDDKETSGFQKEDLPDLAVAWVIITMGTAVAVALGTGGFMILSGVASLLMPAMIIIAVFYFVAMILTIVSRNK